MLSTLFDSVGEPLAASAQQWRLNKTENIEDNTSDFELQYFTGDSVSGAHAISEESYNILKNGLSAAFTRYQNRREYSTSYIPTIVTTHSLFGTLPRDVDGQILRLSSLVKSGVLKYKCGDIVSPDVNIENKFRKRLKCMVVHQIGGLLEDRRVYHVKPLLDGLSGFNLSECLIK